MAIDYKFAANFSGFDLLTPNIQKLRCIFVCVMVSTFLTKEVGSPTAMYIYTNCMW